MRFARDRTSDPHYGLRFGSVNEFESTLSAEGQGTSSSLKVPEICQDKSTASRALTSDNSPVGLNAAFAVALFVQREGHMHEGQADQEKGSHFWFLAFQ